MKAAEPDYTRLLPQQVGNEGGKEQQWLPMVDTAYRGMIWAAAALVVVETLYGPADWIPQFSAIILAATAVPASFPQISRSIITLIFGLLEVAMHISYHDEWLGLMWLIVAVLLSVASMVTLVLACQSQPLRSTDSWLPLEQPPPGCPSCCGSCGCRWVTCSCCGLFFVWTGFVIVAYFLTESACVYQSYYVDDVLKLAAGSEPAMMIGTDSNSDLPPKVNLTGVWWIHFEKEPMPFYNKFHVEELATFEGATTEHTGHGNEYPAHVMAPTATLKHWGFSNTLVSRIAMVVISTKDPQHPMDLDFYNHTVAQIRSGDDNVQWWMTFQNADRWLREIGQRGSPGMWYNLERVIFQNGQAQPEHWADFKKHMGRTKIRVWTTDSKCMRECAVKPFRTCGSCESECKQ